MQNCSCVPDADGVQRETILIFTQKCQENYLFLTGKKIILSLLMYRKTGNIKYVLFQSLQKGVQLKREKDNILITHFRKSDI